MTTASAKSDRRFLYAAGFLRAVAVGPMQGQSLATALHVAAALEILYDILLYAAFRRRPAPEEGGGIFD